MSEYSENYNLESEHQIPDPYVTALSLSATKPKPADIASSRSTPRASDVRLPSATNSPVIFGTIPSMPAVPMQVAVNTSVAESAGASDPNATGPVAEAFRANVLAACAVSSGHPTPLMTTIPDLSYAGYPPVAQASPRRDIELSNEEQAAPTAVYGDVTEAFRQQVYSACARAPYETPTHGAPETPRDLPSIPVLPSVSVVADSDLSQQTPRLPPSSRTPAGSIVSRYLGGLSPRRGDEPTQITPRSTARGEVRQTPLSVRSARGVPDMRSPVAAMVIEEDVVVAEIVGETKLGDVTPATEDQSNEVSNTASVIPVDEPVEVFVTEADIADMVVVAASTESPKAASGEVEIREVVEVPEAVEAVEVVQEGVVQEGSPMEGGDANVGGNDGGDNNGEGQVVVVDTNVEGEYREVEAEEEQQSEKAVEEPVEAVAAGADGDISGDEPHAVALSSEGEGGVAGNSLESDAARDGGSEENAWESAQGTSEENNANCSDENGAPGINSISSLAEATVTPDNGNENLSSLEEIAPAENGGSDDNILSGNRETSTVEASAGSVRQEGSLSTHNYPPSMITVNDGGSMNPNGPIPEDVSPKAGKGGCFCCRRSRK